MYTPPGMSNYKILVLSGFDIEVKKSKIIMSSINV